MDVCESSNCFDGALLGCLIGGWFCVDVMDGLLDY